MENFEHPFRDKKIRPNRKIEKDKDNSGLSRRDFLKIAGIGGLSLAGGSLFLNWCGKKEKNKDRKKHLRKIPEYTEEQEEIEEENIRSIKEIIDFNKEGRIEFNKETAESLKNHWKEKYQKNTELKDSFIEAYHKIGNWDPYLKKEFSESGVPKKFRYLMIPESHADLQAKSEAGAVGPYQFISDTGKSYGLNHTSHSNIEERRDPIKSAGACASYLKDLFEKGGQDWDLALSGYNGGFYWRYRKLYYRSYQMLEESQVNYEEFSEFLEKLIERIRKRETEKINELYEEMANKEKHEEVPSKEKSKIREKMKEVGIDKEKGLNYEGFLKFLEEIINQSKEEKQKKIENVKENLSAGTVNYEIKPGDNLRKIAIKTGINLDKLQKINQIQNPNEIYAGQIIKIPLTKEKREEIQTQTAEKAEKEFWQEIKGFSENLNYPPKFNAVMELIREDFVSEQNNPCSYQTYTAPNKEGAIYHFQKKDRNIYQLARQFPGLDYQDILTANPDLDPNKLKGGEKIIIPAPDIKITLRNIAKAENKPLKHLIELNPAIINPDKEIPSGFKLRI